MSTLASKLANKKFAFRDVTICLDGELSTERDRLMSNLTAEIKSQEAGKSKDARLSSNPVTTAKKAVEAVEDKMREASITLRITAVPFGEYNKFIIQNPPRKGHAADSAWGFNSEAFFMFVARRTAKLLEADGNLIDVSEPEWVQLEAALTDGDHDRIAAAIVEINRREGQRGVDFLSRG